ncbi:MAG: cytochrome P460 family protein [Steroidobacteraceae bacterium]
MHNRLQRLSIGALLLLPVAFGENAAAPVFGPQFTAAGELRPPQRYREWVYLSTGFDMSYRPTQATAHHMFDNVFVAPEAYQSFVQTGTWPDKTMMVLETRGAEERGSPNRSGSYQSTQLMGLEVHVKDEARFAGGWGFFGFDGLQPAKVIPHSATCYTCHAAHAAVDTTFVQFYPTLLPIARMKGTLSTSYQKDVAAEAH